MKKAVRRTMIYGILAVFLFGALFLATFRSRRSQAKENAVQIVVFGDSVMGLVRDETAVPARLQALTGKTVFNAALGGTCAARSRNDRGMDLTMGSLSLVGLTRAVWAEDFSVQQSVRIQEDNTEYFAETIDGLAKTDFSRAETIIIQQGLNDYHSGTLIENPEDPYDVHTYMGALRTSIKALKKVNPELRILLLTPTFAWYVAPEQTCDEIDYGGGTLSDYVEAEIRLAQELDLEIVDLYCDVYSRENWEDWEAYTVDGIHPNEAAREMLAQRIAENL